jgi:putative tryptophan/tyrosine transport system substrate-binding protein
MNSRAAENSQHIVAAFLRGLKDNGYVVGQNVEIEYSWAAGQGDRLPTLATNLVRRPVAVLVATGGEQAALAAKAATSTIPIVFSIGSDPVSLGLVRAYNRPGGNITGVNVLTGGLETKRLGLLHDLSPEAATVGVLADLQFPTTSSQLNEVRQAAGVIGLKVQVLGATTGNEIETAFASLAANGIRALTVLSNPGFSAHRDKLVALSARYRVPTMFQLREYAVAGGLMSYGIDLLEGYRQVGVYTARVLQGTKPGDLPIVEPTKFEFVINLKTAKSLGIRLSSDLLSLADEVIE